MGGAIKTVTRKPAAEFRARAHARVWLAALVLLAAGACSEDPAADAAGGDAPRADTLYVGAHIITMDPAFADATAVAVRGDTITWVGQADAWPGTAHTVVELGSEALLPGFIDAHGHLSFLALTVDLANVASPPVGPVTDIAALQAELARHIERRSVAPGDWVVGMGYDDSLIAEQRHPHRDDLDAVSSAHPIALIHVSGHLAAANSRALALAGITADTPDPEGGVIRRRPGSNEPNGVLEETATYSIRQFFPSGPNDENLAKAQHTYARYGITTVQDGASSPGVVNMLRDAAARNLLTLDVVMYPIAMDPGFELPDDLPLGRYENRLKLGGIKLLLDGSPQGKTAYLSQPYAVPPPGAKPDYRGYAILPAPEIDARVARFLSAGVPIIAHANGDAAAEMLVDAVEQAVAETPFDDHRTVMIHAQTVREDQLDRMANLGMLPSYFSAHTFFWGDWHRDSVLGPERAARISPSATTLARGMPFTVHNDAPIVPPDMMRLLWATVNRITRSGAVLGEAQRISTLDALRAVTVNAAYQYFEEDRKGSLTPGKQADLVILSRNPLEVPGTDLLDVEVVQTVSAGEVVYTWAEPAP